MDTYPFREKDPRWDIHTSLVLSHPFLGFAAICMQVYKKIRILGRLLCIAQQVLWWFCNFFALII